jgi:hypothetical protein
VTRSLPGRRLRTVPRAPLLPPRLSPKRPLEDFERPDFSDPSLFAISSPLHFRITAVLGGERDDVGGQGRLITRCRRSFALRGTMLAKNTTSKAFGYAMFGNDVFHAGTAAGGAYQFPEAASLRISFSSVRSETARRNCLFSVSSSLSRLT